MLRVENEMLHAQYDQIYNEFEVLKWYIDIYENGHNTKDLLKNFFLAQAEIKALKESKRAEKLRLEKLLNSANF